MTQGRRATGTAVIGLTVILVSALLAGVVSGQRFFRVRSVY